MTINDMYLGPDPTPLQQGRSPHGRWRCAYQPAQPVLAAEAEPADEPLDQAEQAAAREPVAPVPARLRVRHDADRLVFALTDGPAAAFLADYLVDYLWPRETADDDWPQNLRSWLADTAQWADEWPDAVPDMTGFVCGRLERGVTGGRMYLAWLGLDGVTLLDSAGDPVTLDTVLGEGEGWTPTNGPEPVGMALHAYRGSLFGLGRLMVVSEGAGPLSDDLPDMSRIDLEQALEDWSAETPHDLAFFDLRLTPVLTEPSGVMLSYRWTAPDLCELSWHTASAATAYRVEEDETPDFDDPALLAELTDSRQLRYRFSPPASEARFYRVVPLNQGVEGTPSNPVSLVPMALAPPVLEPVTWSENGGYFLRWSPIEQASSYEVQSAPSPDFAPDECQIIYRGELPEVHLSPDTAPHQYYRVRALNTLYAPNMPSAWSRPCRAPARLVTPVFTSVTQRRIEWTPVPGARQYAIRVTAKGEDEDHQGETLYTVEAQSAVADQPATYRVRALRHPDDQRTASEWSKPVTVSPPEALLQPASPNLRVILPVLIGATLVALVMGVGLGLGGMEWFQQHNATATRTRIPEAMIQATTAVAELNVDNATAAAHLTATRAVQVEGTATASQYTRTPTPSDTPSATNTPNLTETFAAAFSTAQTATATRFTATPSPTDTPDMTMTFAAAFEDAQTATAAQFTATPSPTDTPDMTMTFAAGFVGAQTATAAQFTATPSPTDTPDARATFEAEFNAALTATATRWTMTPAPSEAPDARATFEARFNAALTATATRWTATPPPTATPDIRATFEAEFNAALTATATRRAAAWAAAAEPVAYGDLVSEVLAPGGVDRWRFTGAAGDVIRIAITPRTFTVALIGPGGDLLALNAPDQPLEAFALPGDGPYIIQVQGDGAYTLLLGRESS